MVIFEVTLKAPLTVAVDELRVIVLFKVPLLFLARRAIIPLLVVLNIPNIPSVPPLLPKSPSSIPVVLMFNELTFVFPDIFALPITSNFTLGFVVPIPTEPRA